MDDKGVDHDAADGEDYDDNHGEVMRLKGTGPSVGI